ncbi:hypothetical protein [Flavobacterium orientale]|nr:hypothetical protein [Flavobacterium orientale]
MKTILTFLFVFGISCVTFSQKVLNSFSIQQNKDSIVSIYPFVDERNHESYMLLHYPNEIVTYKFSVGFRKTDSISAKIELKKEEYIVGHSFEEEEITLFTTKDNFQSIIRIVVDFENKIFRKDPFDFKINNENIITCFNAEQSFHVLTFEETKNEIVSFTFKNLDAPETRKFDLSKIQFTDNDNKSLSLKAVFFNKKDDDLSPFPIMSFENNYPFTLMDSYVKRKLFFHDDKYYLLLNYNSNFTHVLEFDSKSASVTDYKIPVSPLNGSYKNNSYFMDGLIFEQVSNSNEFAFSIKNLKGEILKEHKVNLKESINFKNSEFRYENSETDQPVKIKNTKSFLKRLHKTNPAISVYKNHSNYLVTMGGISSKEKSPGWGLLADLAINGILILNGEGGYESYFYNNKNGYKYKSVSFDALFDQNLNPITRAVQATGMDKLMNFIDNNKESSTIVFFKRGSHFVLGYKDWKTNEFVFRKFED